MVILAGSCGTACEGVELRNGNQHLHLVASTCLHLTCSLEDESRNEKQQGAVRSSHAWSLADAAEVNPEALESWVAARLEAHKNCLDRLLQAKKQTLESTWRPYDDAVAALSQSGSECGLLDSVHPSKPVRDKAQQLAQRVAEAATALSLNQEVYRALAVRGRQQAQIDATRHYVDRTLLQYRLAGVDKDEATRARLRELQDKATAAEPDHRAQCAGGHAEQTRGPK